MEKNLLRASDYCIFTFGSTSFALKAEAHLKSIEADFVIIPTLREISASCGLSAKMYCEDMKKLYDSLQHENIQVEAVYSVSKKGHKLHIEQVNPAPEC